MVHSGSCIYVAGDYKEVKDKRGTMDASGLVRWCIGDPGTVLKVDEQRSEAGVTSEYWEQVDLPEGSYQFVQSQFTTDRVTISLHQTFNKTLSTFMMRAEFHVGEIGLLLFIIYNQCPSLLTEGGRFWEVVLRIVVSALMSVARVWLRVDAPLMSVALVCPSMAR